MGSRYRRNPSPITLTPNTGPKPDHKRARNAAAPYLLFARGGKKNADQSGKIEPVEDKYCKFGLIRSSTVCTAEPTNCRIVLHILHRVVCYSYSSSMVRIRTILLFFYCPCGVQKVRNNTGTYVQQVSTWYLVELEEATHTYTHIYLVHIWYQVPGRK